MRHFVHTIAATAALLSLTSSVRAQVANPNSPGGRTSDALAELIEFRAAHEEPTWPHGELLFDMGRIDPGLFNHNPFPANWERLERTCAIRVQSLLGRRAWLTTRIRRSRIVLGTIGGAFAATATVWTATRNTHVGDDGEGSARVRRDTGFITGLTAAGGLFSAAPYLTDPQARVDGIDAILNDIRNSITAIITGYRSYLELHERSLSVEVHLACSQTPGPTRDAAVLGVLGRAPTDEVERDAATVTRACAYYPPVTGNELIELTRLFAEIHDAERAAAAAVQASIGVGLGTCSGTTNGPGTDTTAMPLRPNQVFPMRAGSTSDQPRGEAPRSESHD